jgi:cyclophilin family peptidyl-prolyl cis-trans isomerase
VKTFFYAALVGALMACSPAETEAPPTTSTTTETAASATETTTADTAASSATATGTSQENSMTDTAKVAEIKTTKGDITIRFFPDVAPNHVQNFVDLSQKGFYNGTKFHRIIPGFMIQGGDPNTKSGPAGTWGTGGSDTRLKSEFSTVSHKRGIVSMARSQDPNSASSQFFIVVKDSPFLDNQYTVFGQVTKGMDVADAIVNAPRGANDRPDDPVSITSVTIRDASDSEKGPAPR